MDKLGKRLRDDAASIDAEISAELDYRIRASLHGVEPERARPASQPARPYSRRWASSLTGIAAAIAVIAIINLERPGPEPIVSNPVQPLVLPIINLKVEAAMLTSPLQQELEALQSDLRKAEQAVREDVDLSF
jgi:hypothetical protein